MTLADFVLCCGLKSAACSHRDADPHAVETMDKGDDAVITLESVFTSEQENVNVGDGSLDDFLEFVTDNLKIVSLFVCFGW